MKNWLPPVSCHDERHADGAAQERALVQLVANRVAGPAFAVAARIAVLHDEVRHDAVDLQAVEEALARERDEVAASSAARRAPPARTRSCPCAVSMNTCGEYGGAISVRIVVRRDRRARRRPDRVRDSRRAGSSLREQLGGAARGPPSPCRRAPPSASRVASAAPYSASAASDGRARVDRPRPPAPALIRLAQRLGAAGWLQLATIRAAVGADGEVRLLQLREQRSRPASGAFRRASARSTDGNDALVLVVQHRPQAIERDLGGQRRPARPASAARTVQCGSGSMPDRTSRKLSGSIAAAARSAAARIAGHWSVSRSWTIGSPSAALQRAERGHRLEPHVRIGRRLAASCTSGRGRVRRADLRRAHERPTPSTSTRRLSRARAARSSGSTAAGL